MPEEKSKDYSRLWETVKKELEKREMSANKVAVLESEKILKKVIEDVDLPGKDIDSEIENYEKLFSNIDRLRYSRAMYRKIITKPGFDISQEDTREIIKGYHEAISDLEKIDFKGFSYKEKMDLFLRRNFYGFSGIIKKALLGLIALSVGTFILTETQSGRAISGYIVSINNYLFYQIIPAIIILLILIAIGIGIVYAYKSKSK